MSKIKRSTYQKVAEENKRLIKDIRILVNMDGDMNDWLKCQLKWYSKFKKEEEQNELIKEACKSYVIDNKDKYPDLYKKIQEENI